MKTQKFVDDLDSIITKNLYETEQWLRKLDNNFLASLEGFFNDDRNKIVIRLLRERKIKKLNYDIR